MQCCSRYDASPRYCTADNNRARRSQEDAQYVGLHEALNTELTRSADGHYLNLPVVEADGRLVAIVDVLKLTYATLEQVSDILGFRKCNRLTVV